MKGDKRLSSPEGTRGDVELADYLETMAVKYACWQDHREYLQRGADRIRQLSSSSSASAATPAPERGTMRDIDPATLESLHRQVNAMSNRGIWPDGAPNESEQRYDEGFKSAMAHVSRALDALWHRATPELKVIWDGVSAATPPKCEECDGRGEYLDAPGHVLDGSTYVTRCHVCGGTGNASPRVSAATPMTAEEREVFNSALIQSGVLDQIKKDRSATAQLPSFPATSQEVDSSRGVAPSRADSGQASPRVSAATPAPEFKRPLEVTASYVLGGWSKTVSNEQELLQAIDEGRRLSPIDEVSVRPYHTSEEREAFRQQQRRYDEMRGVSAAERPAPMWQPMEDAPKGKAVLLWVTWRYVIGHFRIPDNQWVQNWDGAPIEPSHWMPLPAPPGPVAQEKDK